MPNHRNVYEKNADVKKKIVSYKINVLFLERIEITM